MSYFYYVSCNIETYINTYVHTFISKYVCVHFSVCLNQILTKPVQYNCLIDLFSLSLGFLSFSFYFSLIFCWRNWTISLLTAHSLNFDNFIPFFCWICQADFCASCKLIIKWRDLSDLSVIYFLLFWAWAKLLHKW